MNDRSTSLKAQPAAHGAWMSSARRVVVPLGMVMAVLAVVAGYAFQYETERWTGELETAAAEARIEARRLSRGPPSELTARISEVARSNSSQLYALYEGTRRVAGPALSGGPVPPHEPWRRTHYKAQTESGRIDVYGAWVAAQGGLWLFYGERVGPYRQRGLALPAAILGAGAFAAIALSVWAVFAERSARRRLQAIEARLGRFAEGALDVRLAARGDDDIDRVSAQVNQTLGRLERVVSSLRLLSDQVAHEMKGGVARIRRRVERATAATLKADHDRWLAEAEAECGGMLAAIDGLLTLSTIETRDLQALAPVSLDVEVARTVEMMRLLADDAGLEVVVSLEPVVVRGDASLLTQLTANLFENAVKYGASGGRIEVSLAPNADGATLTVADRGPGVPPAERDSIFLPRRRLSRDAGLEGYGYGLALARSIAGAHGGTIHVEDAAPGARFVVILPRATIRSVQPSPAPAHSPSS